MIRAAFVMEQHLGHGSFYQNLRRFLAPAPQLDAQWVEVTYTQTGGFWEKWRVLPKHIRGTLSGRSQVRGGLGTRRNDVAFFNTQVPAALGGTLLRRQPYVLCTDIMPIQYDAMGEQYGHQADGKGLVASYKHWANVRMLQNASYVLPWSTWARDSLVADYGVDPSRIRVVPPGVDTAVWHPVEKEREGPVRILFVGGDLRRKGGNLLIEAFRELPVGAAELILVTRTPVESGQGITVRNDLQANAPELISLYQTSDLFVFPTQAEAFGIAAVEASAAGLPIIATRVGGLSDIVIDGETGFLFDPHDRIALFTALQALVGDASRRRLLGAAGRLRAEKYFDARKNAYQIADILHEVAEK